MRSWLRGMRFIARMAQSCAEMRNQIPRANSDWRMKQSERQARASYILQIDRTFALVENLIPSFIRLARMQTGGEGGIRTPGGF